MTTRTGKKSNARSQAGNNRAALVQWMVIGVILALGVIAAIVLTDGGGGGGGGHTGAPASAQML